MKQFNQTHSWFNTGTLSFCLGIFVIAGISTVKAETSLVLTTDGEVAVTATEASCAEITTKLTSELTEVEVLDNGASLDNETKLSSTTTETLSPREALLKACPSSDVRAYYKMNPDGTLELEKLYVGKEAPDDFPKTSGRNSSKIVVPERVIMVAKEATETKGKKKAKAKRR